MRTAIGRHAAAALAGIVLAASGVSGQAAPASETYTATASVKSEDLHGTAPVRILIRHFATDAERASVMKALKSSGTPAVKAVLAKMKTSGTLELAKTKATIKYAYASMAGSTRIVTVATDHPLLHLGGGLPDAKAKAGYDLAVALLYVEADGSAHGELYPAAKVATNESGAITIEDYGDAKIWLKDVAKAK